MTATRSDEPPSGADPGALLARAERAFDAGDLAGAEQAFRRLAEISPAHPDALNGLGVVARHRGDLRGAIEYFERALTADPSRDYVLRNLVMVLHAAGRLHDASRRAAELVAAAPERADAHCVLGRLQMELGRRAAGIDSFRKAVALEPGSVDALHGLAEALMISGELTEAENVLARLNDVAPDFPGGHFALGNLRKKQWRLDEARACYQRALEASPRAVEILVELGDCHQRAGDEDEARACFARALSEDPAVAARLLNRVTTSPAGRVDLRLRSFLARIAR
ncbi:MAG: tetratricopeptide repeat protein [Gammaproteobacteria bacterium]|nr:tetratricopeptide repeat protein [Gammaproteobacteria bacterium]